MVFIGWSGDRSKRLATALRKALRSTFDSLNVWMSASDIEVGSLWFNKLNRALRRSSLGVLCLTPENLEAPWIVFEAGSLAKGASSARVVPYRLELQADDVPSPLRSFQAVDADEAGTLQVFKAVNKTLSKPLDGRHFAKLWNEHWPALKSEIDAIRKSERPIPVKEVEQQRQRFRKLSARIAGPWWERVRGHGLGFFLIERDDPSVRLRLVEGRFYSEKAELVAFWSGTSTEIMEQSDKLKIEYMRQCKVPKRDGKDWFHGYGDLYFKGESPDRGTGMFYDVTVKDRMKMVPIDVALRRVYDRSEVNTMLSGGENDRKALVKRVIHAIDNYGTVA